MDGRKFHVEGMDCADEVNSLKDALASLAGGEENLTFDLLRSRLVVRTDPVALSDEKILSAVSRTGMNAQVVVEGAVEHLNRVPRRQLIVVCTGGALLMAALVAHAVIAGGVFEAMAGTNGAGHGIPLLPKVLYSFCILLSVRYVLPKAWSALKSYRPDMNLLMTIAVIGAIAIGEWFEAATVSFLFAVALYLESWSVGRARRAVEALMETAPTSVRLRGEDGSVSAVSPDAVPVGSVFLVRPGDRIALDGEVLSGDSDVNEAPITGESVPAAKQPGDEVFAGTVNGDGALEVRSSRRSDQTTLANIIRLVTEAHTRRAPSERWVERFARRYTPSVLLAALAVLLVPPLLLEGEWAVWFYRSLVLLVIACPCALVISTPVTIVAALASAARHGVLIKGGLHLESPAEVRAIALDKTGTLTRGRPSVMAIRPMNEHSETELLERAATLERGSSHPLAQAILDAAEERGLQLQSADGFRVVPGRGAHGAIDGREYWIGSHRYLRERGQETPEVLAAVEEMTDASHTVVILGTVDHVCGLIALVDSPREEAGRALAALRSAGIRHLAMLTGDNAETADAVATEVGISEVHSELLPEDKVSIMEELVSEHGIVAMVGDGVNDAPAMARASLSIAMGAAGSDAAIETADIALMSDDLTRLPWLVRHSRRALSVIRQNVALSLGVKLVFVLLSITGHASLWSAIAADMGTSLLVTFNGLRLLRPGAGL